MGLMISNSEFSQKYFPELTGVTTGKISTEVNSGFCGRNIVMERMKHVWREGSSQVSKEQKRHKTLTAPLLTT